MQDLNQMQSLQSLVRQQKISRREFLGRLAALGIAAPAAATLFAQTALAADPKRGGHVKIGLAGASVADSLDPGTWADTFMQMLGMGMCFNCLTEVSPQGELIPELADSWEASSGAATWTFALKKDVTFHNGKEFTAADVIASIRHHMGADSSSYAKSIVDLIADIRADGDHRVVFDLTGGNADFPYMLSDYHLTISPAGQAGDAKGVGTGGYMLESFDPGVRAVAKRNPNYFKSGRAHFDTVELIGIADVAQRSSALITGAVHAINRVDLKTERLLKRDKNVEIVEVTGNQHYTFPMNTTLAPFDNNDVRLALKYVVKRDELVQKVLNGHGLVGNDHPIGPANRYFARDMEQRSYDPDKAKFHLKKAGLSKLAVKLSVSDGAFSGSVDAGVLYAESARPAGIAIEIVREPKDGYWSNVWKKKPWCASYWSGRATEDWMFSNAYAREANGNESYWDNAKFNTLLVAARAELDDAKRRDMYREMQQLVRDEGGSVIPMYANYVDAASTKLAHGDDIGNAWQMDGVRLAERWWFA